LNNSSSRSHLILSFTSSSRKVTFVDLAGKEGVKSSNVIGETLQEAKFINASLETLSKVLLYLRSNKQPPYFESKLTTILRNSLGKKKKIF
jgi:hypothetical protein